MTIEKAIVLGTLGNILSKTITGTTKVSAARTTVAVGAGTTLGAATAGTILIVGGVAVAPIAIPLAIATGIVSGIASLFD